MLYNSYYLYPLSRGMSNKVSDNIDYSISEKVCKIEKKYVDISCENGIIQSNI